MEKISIQQEEVIFESVLQIERATIKRVFDSGKTQEFTRLKLNRVDAAAVLVYHKEWEKIILTRQFRYAVHDRVTSPLLEIVAGKVDHNEDHLTTAMRETEEEIGYRVRQENMHYQMSFFASPGYTSEKYHLYFAEVCEADRVNEGGGLENEYESIEKILMSKAEFFDLLENNQLEDAKTIVAALSWKLKESSGVK